MHHGHWEAKTEKQQPFSELPVWARLEFAKMIPETYFYDYEKTSPINPRKVQDAYVRWFERLGDVIWIHYEIEWPGEDAARYIAPLVKNWGANDSHYRLTPLSDPTAFAEIRDGRSYHLCNLPGHVHHIPFPFATCHDNGTWTWESRYSR